MNKRQVTILWVIAIALGAAVTAVKLSQDTTNRSATKRVPPQTLFESFPASEATTIEIQGAASSVTLAKKDAKWVVTQRDNYPANSTFVNDLIRTLGDLKVIQGMEAGPSFAPRFGMDETATLPADRGLTATFKDGGGKELAKVSLGKNIESGSAPSPMGGSNAVGRYVRNHADDSGFYAVSEMFPSVSADAKSWLSNDFISPEKIKSITVSLPGKADPAWKLSRDGEEAEYKLEGAAAAAEVLDTTASSPLKSLFSYARFDDVIPAAKVAERIVADTKRTAVIETFEGFTYTVSFSPTQPSPAAAAPVSPGAEPAVTDNFLLTVDVAAELPKERKKADGEKPEDAKAKDSAFTERHKTLTEKLAKEKAFAGVTFEVAKSTIEPLLKDRAGLIAKATPPAPQGASNGGVQKLPGGMIARPPVSATTPPIEAVSPPISVPIVEGEQDDEEPANGVQEEDK